MGWEKIKAIDIDRGGVMYKELLNLINPGLERLAEIGRYL